MTDYLGVNDSRVSSLASSPAGSPKGGYQGVIDIPKDSMLEQEFINNDPDLEMTNSCWGMTKIFFA